MEVYDFAIVGAGMAGASLAAGLAGQASVVVLEAEDQPGFHSTGRSAAFWEECYGGPEIVPLTLASGEFLRDGGFLNRRGALYVGRKQDKPRLDAFEERFGSTGATFERLDAAGLRAMIPGIRDDWCDAIWEPACADIDVAGLHQHYLKGLRSGGADLVTKAELDQAEYDGGEWQLQTSDGREYRARTLVNAAGAWADRIAEIAGCRPVGIGPLRRTVAQLRVSPAPAATNPLVLDISGRFYFKPESGRLWLSPHDEEPSEPCDAAPEELAVAEAIDRLESVVDWKVEAVERKWAGLRSFAPDRLPVYGPDPRKPAFFWFAGQGGYGIQTAPAAAAIATAMLLQTPREDFARGIDASIYSPERFG
ncbi:NAD(P)/FAD-dependent oxidoreductase [Pontixanthobacter luteolus]|uniref:NAD(P)/FAD-dependent oxidoreductase n=1 Tax=Pontixanthobacter luteolus TaxID=295089 RepID=UPI002302ACDD|nr:FAD-dependent oxidoreductase [Pontixanthobacter luteolus]